MLPGVMICSSHLVWVTNCWDESMADLKKAKYVWHNDQQHQFLCWPFQNIFLISVYNWLRKWDVGMQKVFCEGDGSLLLLETNTPAVVITQGHLPLSLLCVQTAAAWCNAADKLENVKNISHYPPTSTSTPCGSAAAAATAAAADTDSGQPPGRGLCFHLLNHNEKWSVSFCSPPLVFCW